MTVRTMIKSGQSISAFNSATINQALNVAETGNGLNVATALNVGVAAQTSVATGVSVGAVSVGVSLSIQP
jgi:hypothetical protein